MFEHSSVVLLAICPYARITMTEFVPELELARRFYEDLVAPVLSSELADAPCSVALIGDGSGVLGYDTPMSRDHDWGPRLQIVVDESIAGRAPEIEGVLDERLPESFLGYPVRFGKGGSPARHHIEVLTVSSLLEEILGVSSIADLKPSDWLTFPQQKLLALTSGRVFRDDTGSLGVLRNNLSYYPQDVWLYLLASGWRLLSQEMPFVGRCGDMGDELGSRTITARQCNRVMTMAFVTERRYAPYTKWFGTAFKRLKLSRGLEKPLKSALSSVDWRDRERNLAEAYRGLVAAFNDLSLLPPVPVGEEPFYDRPYIVVNGPQPELIRCLMHDNLIKALPLGVGGVDQVTDNVDVLARSTVFHRLEPFYSGLGE